LYHRIDNVVGCVDGLPSNGLVFSCRERAGRRLQHANDLAREAVSWNTVLGRTAMIVRR